MSFERSKKIGFLRSGGRTPVDAEKLEKKRAAALKVTLAELGR
jgi:hypothetical protein